MVPLPAAGTKTLRSVRADAIFAGLDGAMPESGVRVARTLAARAGCATGKLRELRSAPPYCAAAAGAPLSNAGAPVGELPPDWAPALRRRH